ncbi:MAG: aminoglycoside phosphotransferase family protein [Kiritimatiellae bacterium]|nr:aminoglycoside phosphotransferase family protein [Kiritimatiellia bacterium]
MTHSEETIKQVVANFFPEGEVVHIEQSHGGHINQTYFVDCKITSSDVHRYVLQCLNRKVFPDLPGLMDNVLRVSEQMSNYAKEHNMNMTRSYLHFIRTVDGAPAVDDEKLGFWRMYRYINNAVGKQVAESPLEAFKTAEAFGLFQGMLSGITGPRLVETIKAFHDTRKRYERLERAAKEDKFGRFAESKEIFDGLMAIKPYALALQEAFDNGEIPERVVHNDAKLSNILLDVTTGNAICVIDLDTCMPGLAGHDFGDMARSMSSQTAEDEEDLSKIAINFDIYNSLIRGFLKGAKGVLNDREVELLPDGGIAMTTEVAVRFLTDYLEGDVYFSIKFEGHNLRRARSQLRLAECMVEALPKLRELVNSAK